MIQIDMFEVQLGAAMLLQFRTSKRRVVKVLADAGIKASEYPLDHVHRKLRGCFDNFGNHNARLDLIIGTHYDADHLDGLVPIIKDNDMQITEVWLPPVTNDSDLRAFDQPVAERDFLPQQFYSDRDRRVLAKYLNAKEWVCRYIRSRSGQNDDPNPVPESRLSEKMIAEDTLESAKEVFLRYRREALDVLEELSDSHADDNRFEPKGQRELFEVIDWRNREMGWPRRYAFGENGDEEEIEGVTRFVSPRSVGDYNFASIRKSAADDAINAISLAKVVEALRLRRPPVPVVCHLVPDGRPRRFAWRSDSERFEGGYRLVAQGPEILLLGPSEGLVERHRNRLPIAAYGWAAMASMMRLRNITPSNQLSYVACFRSERQNVLVTGDAGCVDFLVGRSKAYHPELLAVLRRLHVVQVAHHAGNNAHFYRVLSAAGYGRQKNRSYLLVSHGTDDQHRPSREFGSFLEEVRGGRDQVQILFTSRPMNEKVRDYVSMIHPSVGEAAAGDEKGPTKGDVRLVFERRKWMVKKHGISAGRCSSELQPQQSPPQPQPPQPQPLQPQPTSRAVTSFGSPRRTHFSG